MQQKMVLVIIAIALVVIGAWYWGGDTGSADATTTGQNELQSGESTQSGVDEPNEMSDEVEMVDKVMADKETSLDEGGETMKGSYEAYAPEKLALASEGDVVLFFKADWCPSCRALDSDITANRDAIPEGVTILDVDYDDEIELKKKYGITTQHTFVQVDAEGNAIKKWTGSPTLARLVTEIE